MMFMEQHQRIPTITPCMTADNSSAHMDNTDKPAWSEENPDHPPVIHIRTLMPSVDTRMDLADTGASISATGIKELLHDFTPHTNYEIVGYDGTRTTAAGQGVAKVYNRQTGRIEDIFFVYAPSVEGTILSLEHHARMHPSIHRWLQEATHSAQTGTITFLDDSDKIISQYQTVRVNGLYCIQHLDFIPVSTTHTMAQLTVLHIPEDYTTSTNAITEGTQMMDDFHMDTMAEYLEMELKITKTSITWKQDSIPTRFHHHPITLANTSVTPAIGSNPTPTTIRDTATYLMWHQRLAHCSSQTLHKTSQLVDGMPVWPTTRLLLIVTCRACDIAQSRKNPKGPTIQDPEDLKAGHVFQMDIGFIRGPCNLEGVVHRREESQPRTIQSRQGYTCYLLIIDRYSRYLWVFPLKTKSIPEKLITQFLSIHAAPRHPLLVIRTDGEG